MVRKTRNFADDDVNEPSAFSNSGSSERSEATRDAMSSIVCEFRSAGGLLSECTGSGDVTVHGPDPPPHHLHTHTACLLCFVLFDQIRKDCC